MDELILGIETSCDETAAAVVCGGTKVLSNIISSQIDIHKRFGGVVPEIASRKHVETILPIIQRALDSAQLAIDDLDAVAVTYGPGLVGALLVGVSAAKAIAFAADLPLIGVNHIEGHITANRLSHPELKPPLICLTVSGGHTDLLYVPQWGSYTLLGQTRDDAAGEAFDKVARTMGLGYPGGPLIDQLAKEGNPVAIRFPRALANEGYDFSFSGLKTAVVNYLHNARQRQDEVNLADVAASFQEAVVDILVRKAIAVAQEMEIGTIILSGGVAANTRLREAMTEEGRQQGINVYYPDLVYCTDNAAMIAGAAHFAYERRDFADLELNAVANLGLI
ncbi:MAG: tRNA (adenosine(37)-N6)-threonylcarbamoyltransferase complex transferase subunit TsaD [Limnochordia bacterium]|jgi:N6-L-threonylcarbamoyladenine synthase|nr:tRNA (adenosine(37)-N6)-threonylcarbamoyltransferase complex transferase subunit TsaD [Limnochordia bacterium]MDD2629251.1 tRNA (adenosine(37)-N6)-threonylcarbamoyltransferase complex transferase subunit TsaD [Limnochordia bacterium]MDD4518216.1 tRNA (adenosine(37)-N6)-threonylcarbamoyltransferase complex transferase subunit TsaD [Limnochordia bacterium]